MDLEEFHIKQTDPLEDIKQKLRVAKDYSHLLANNSDSVYLLLFLLILKREGYLKGLQNERPAILVDLIKERLDKDFELGSPLKILMQAALEEYLYNVKEEGLVSVIDLFANFDKDVFNSHFPEIFDDLLFRLSKSLGPYTGEFLQPMELTRFICRLIGNRENQSVYNPFAGVASFNVYLPQSTNYYGQEIIRKIWSIGAMRICAYGNDINSMFMPEDSIKQWNPHKKKFDVIVANAPFNYKLTEGEEESIGKSESIESFIISNSLKDLTEEGKLILVVSNGFLARANKDLVLRKKLIDEDLVEAVISFPGGLLLNTSIPFSIVIINKAKTEKGIVKFIDAKGFVGVTNRKISKIQEYQLYSKYIENKESEFIKNVTNDEIESQNYLLNVNRYFLKKIDGVKLNTIVSVLPLEKTFNEALGIEVKIGDLNSDGSKINLDVKNLNIVELRKGYSKLTSSCLLIASKGKLIKSTYFHYKGTSVFVSNDIYAFQVKSELVSIEYLILELQKEYFTEQLESIRSGSTIQFIKREDFLNLYIKLPSIEEQVSIVSDYRSEYQRTKIRELGLEMELDKLKQQQKEDLSIKKHNIMQHMNNVKSAADLLLNTSQNNNGTLYFNTILDAENNLAVEDIYQEMLKGIRNVLYYVDNITNEISFSQSETVDVSEMVKKAIAQGNMYNERFKVEFSIDHKSFQFIDSDGEIGEISPIVDFSNLDFLELFNNILENAVNHGFTEKSRKYIFRIRLVGDLGASNVILTFSNNGNPFPKGMADRYHIKGEKGGIYGNKGIGSWKVMQIANHFNSEINVHDLNEEEFPVKIELIMPLKNFENEM